ncbi:MAG: type I methionyl aminopeptidase [bacterium]
MTRANEIVAEVLELLEENLQAGVNTKELDELAEQYIRDQDAKPAFKGYRGYPATINASINNQIVHGIPSRKQVVAEGDLVSLDVGACYRGCYGDSAFTVAVEPVTPTARQLLDVTRRSLYRAISEVKPGVRLGVVCNAIESFVKPYGFSVVREWAGHFIGHQLHLEPQIPNYGTPDWGPVLKPGMFMAIEPMVNVGGPATEILPDGWTVVTKDGSLSAHFEHTVAVVEDGVKVLSQRSKEVLM